MSTPSSTATPSPLPIRPVDVAEPPPKPSFGVATRPYPQPTRPKPKLLLEIHDLSTAGSQEFLSAVNPLDALRSSIANVLSYLYNSTVNSEVPGTRSVTFILRPMEHLAYTTCKDIDDDHKEIHLSTSYIEKIPAKRKRDEILGVVTHEMVHCWQWNALGTAPGGLVEGIADWVRLRAGYVPPHWTRAQGGKWDAGYQHTAYFLDFLEDTYGEGSVRRINGALRNCKYDQEKFWKAIFGQRVETLWENYQNELMKQLEVEEKPVVVENPDGTGTPVPGDRKNTEERDNQEEATPTD